MATNSPHTEFPHIPVCPKGEDNCPLLRELPLLRQHVEELQQQVITDHLTQLYNNRHFYRSLEQEMERTRRSQQPTGLIILDIDHFKKVNDNHGHTIGDQALIQVAQLVKAHIRMLDIGCRYGGEEFAVILPATNWKTSMDVAERIRQVVAETPLTLGDGTSLALSASFGVECYDQRNQFALQSAQALVHNADKQLYSAKENGRNRVCGKQHSVTDAAAVSSAEKAALFGDQ